MKINNSETMLSDVLTVEQTRQLLKISKATVYNLLKRNELERANIGYLIRRTLITRESAERLARSRKEVEDQSTDQAQARNTNLRRNASLPKR